MDRRAFLSAAVGTGVIACREAGETPGERPASVTLSDVLARDCLGQAELVRRKEVQPIELVEAVIARVEELNGKLNAIVTPMYDLAREAAKADIPEGPFQGVPFMLKDLGARYGGVRQTAGSRSLAGYHPEADSELVVRQKQAGLIIVAKTNTPEFGLTATTEPHLFGPAHNPWDLERTTGGSSGGSCAAVAARIVPMAHANDGGGSIRIPSSCCGLFGLKPTRARNTLAPVGDYMSGLVSEHAVSLTVRDSAALLDATAGSHPGDPYPAPPKRRPFLEEADAGPGRLRVAFSTRAPVDSPVHEDCATAVEGAARLLEGLGHTVEEASPEVEMVQFRQAFMKLWLSQLAMDVEGIALASNSRPKRELYEPLTWEYYRRGAGIRSAEYLTAIAYLQALSRRFARFFGKYDVWLTPTTGEPPPELGVLHPGPAVPLPDIDQMVARVFQFVPFTQFANVTGQPAMSVPLHWNQEELPIGVHFMGRFGDEATLFRLAGQLEQAKPWIDRKPPVAAS